MMGKGTGLSLPSGRVRGGGLALVWDAALTPKGCQSTGRGEAPAKGGTPHGSPERATEYRKGHITSVMLTKEASHTRYAVLDLRFFLRFALSE